MPRVIVTTALKPNPLFAERAEALAREIGARAVPRRDDGLEKIMRCHGAERALVVETGGLALVGLDGVVYRYHPNLGFVRAYNLMRGQRDVYVDAAEIRPGDRVLDCTLGFGGEALLAAMMVGEEGRVTGLESVPELACVTRDGLMNRSLPHATLVKAMRRITVIAADYRDYLLDAEPGQFEIICFDPFFEQRAEGSEPSINPLLAFGNPAALDPDSVIAAIGIATRRVLVKHPTGTQIPEELLSHRESVVASRHRPLCYSVFPGLADD